MYKTFFTPYTNLYFESGQVVARDMRYSHYHDTYEIYLQTSESRKILFNGYSYTLQPGDLCFLMPFEIHQTLSLNENDYGRYVLNFSDKELNVLLSKSEHSILFSKLSSNIYHLTPNQYEWMLCIFQSMQHSYEKTGFLSDKLISAHLIQILYILKDCATETPQKHLSVESSDIKPEILTAIDYINQNYQNDINLDEVAESVHMSKYYFCRLFSNTLGIGFLEYLNNVRLTKVHQMLVETNLPIRQIAKETGFHSTTHLSRIFSTRYGNTPTDFRKINTKYNCSEPSRNIRK